MEAVNTTYDNDSKDRVGTFIFDPNRERILIGHAPNKKMEPNSWDLVGKGHIQYGDMKEETVNKEVLEESNIDVSELYKIELGDMPYNGGRLYFYALVLPEAPNEIVCKSYFNWFGKQLPEFSLFDWVTLEEAKTRLYKGLSKVIFDKKLKNGETIYSSLQNMLKNGLL